MSKHTPGPWKYVPEKLYQGQHVAGRGPEVIIGDMSVRFRPEHDADALLTAASPDLLAALKKAERYVWEVACETEDGVHTLREDLPEAKLWKEIVAVISRAEGKDHD